MKKLKRHYRHSYTYHSYLGYDFEIYPAIRGVHKSFSTRQEASKAALHSKEYREYQGVGLRIRGKRHGGLPNAWDDYPSYVYKVRKSWKHNSKRAKQWHRIAECD